MRILDKLKNKWAFSLVELLIVIALMSVVTLPAYMALLNGYELFHDESQYQNVISDVQLFYEQLNSRIRLSGLDLKETELISTQVELNKHGDFSEQISGSIIHVFRVLNVFYYLKDDSIYSYSVYSDSDNFERKLVDHVTTFSVTELGDDETTIIDTTINVDGRQETISTTVYKRY